MTPQQLVILSLFFLAAGLILVGAFGGFLFYGLLVRRLKLDHNALWLSLGSPSYIPADPRGASNYWYGALFNWIWRRDYLSIPDPDVVRLGSISRILFVGLFGGLACTALLVLLGVAIMLGI